MECKLDQIAIRKKLRKFRDSYARLSESGLCDVPGGMEYRRVRKEWSIAGYPQDVDQFIRWRANDSPAEEEIVN